ncbi:MAG: aconitase family protein, partial [Clostridia bacterium]|nr:aconitase family protein [Clostridia bacterium]
VDGALYKSMEYSGEGIQYLTIDDRFTICNMAIEAGAKNGIFPIDEVTLEYVHAHSTKKPVIYEADSDAEYDAVYNIDMSKLVPTVAFPHLPSNTKVFGEFGDIAIDQVVIGSCTNGHFSDFVQAAEVLKGKKVNRNVRTLIIPTTQKIYLELIESGLAKQFVEAGAAVSTPTCGPCLGGHMGILAKGERCVATTNRNFVGRMGHPQSEVYLASPAVAAASAVTGKISHPDEVVKED